MAKMTRALALTRKYAGRRFVFCAPQGAQSAPFRDGDEGMLVCVGYRRRWIALHVRLGELHNVSSGECYDPRTLRAIVEEHVLPDGTVMRDGSVVRRGRLVKPR